MSDGGEDQGAEHAFVMGVRYGCQERIVASVLEAVCGRSRLVLSQNATTATRSHSLQGSRAAPCEAKLLLCSASWSVVKMHTHSWLSTVRGEMDEGGPELGREIER